MTLRLAIENIDRLPDGGPLSFEAQARGLDIGRDAHLDWTLPDPSRYVSGKHCEIRFRDGGYWLHDVSTNGTFVNGSQFRLSEPYLLQDGDKFAIGPYIIVAAVKGAPKSAARPEPPPRADADLWGGVGEAAAFEDRRAFRNEAAAPRSPDFVDFAASISPEDAMAPAFAPPRPDLDDWMAAKPSAAPAPVAEAIPLPTPRRPAERPPQAPIPVPAPVVAPLEPAPAAASPAASVAEVVARLAAAAGIPERALAGRDPYAVIDEIGAALRLSAENLAQMLIARAQSKSLMRSSSRTMIRARENNPLKFSASAAEALAIMFGPPSSAYLNAQATIAESFADLKTHQMIMGLATQAAIEDLFEDLAPGCIEKSIEPERGIGGLISSRKAKMWDVFVERWRAKSKRSDGRLNEAFAVAFAAAYDRLLDERS